MYQFEVETQGQLEDWNVIYTGVGKVNYHENHGQINGL